MVNIHKKLPFESYGEFDSFFLLDTSEDRIERINAGVEQDWTPEEEAKLLRKLDLRVLFPCCVIYFLAYVQDNWPMTDGLIKAGTLIGLIWEMSKSFNQEPRVPLPTLQV